MNRAAAARPSGADAEPVGWELAAFEAAVHSDPVELAGAKRALKAFFFWLLPDIKVEDSFGEADQVLSTLMDTAGGAFSDPEDEARFAHQPAGEDGAPPRPDAETDYLKAVDDAMNRFDAANVHIWNALRQDDAKAELISQLSKVFPKLSEVKASTVSGQIGVLGRGTAEFGEDASLSFISLRRMEGLIATFRLTSVRWYRSRDRNATWI